MPFHDNTILEPHLTLPKKEAEKAGFKSRKLAAPGFPVVEPLPNFDWKTTEPIKLRPFKPKYNLTMGLCFVLHSPPTTEIF